MIARPPTSAASATWLLALAACGGGSTGGAAAMPTKTPAPTVAPRADGRTAEEWAPRVVHEDAAVRAEALLALGDLGASALEHRAEIAARLADRDPAVRWAARRRCSGATSTA